MTRTMLDLPPEVQSAIVSWVLRPEDNARLCLVSRQFYDVSMPMLYHSMYLNIERWKENHLKQFLTRGHRGHQYVRSLDVDSDSLNLEHVALGTAKTALNLLPRNCLSSFRCPLEEGVDNDLIILLASTQNKLSFLSLGPLRNNALNLPGCLSPWPRTIRTIVIPWKLFLPTDIGYYQDLIKRSAIALNALTVRSENFDEDREWRPLYRQDRVKDIDGMSTSEYLARNLFKHILTANSCPKLEISDLNLQSQDLKTAADTWLRAIDFTKLRTLQLWNCRNADVLLRDIQIVASNNEMQLHGLVLSFEEPDDAPATALDFVRTVSSGLSYLNLCYIPELDKRTLNPTKELSISHYLLSSSGGGRRLKDLYLGIGSNGMSWAHYEQLRVPLMDDLNSISTTCLDLRQWAIAMPPVAFDDALAGRWGDYGKYMDMLAALPKLKTLRILTWPVISDKQFVNLGHSRRERKAKPKIYLKYLDVFATAFARHFSYARGEHHQRLSVLMFGSAEQQDAILMTDGNLDYSMNGPISYKIRRKETEFGVVTKAKRIESHLMEYEEPVAYVVDEDTDQGLSLEAYSWGA